MRLTRHQTDRIRAAAAARFGHGSAGWVFGSRLVDDARGGDVDLHIEPTGPLPESLFLARQALRAQLEHGLRLPVDMVVLRDEPIAFMRQARAEGKRL